MMSRGTAVSAIGLVLKPTLGSAKLREEKLLDIN